MQRAVPSFDVVIPCRDAESWLAGAVVSAVRCGAGRVVVVDDGSAEPARRSLSASVVAAQLEFAGTPPRVTVVRQVNAGPSAARNAGLARLVSSWHDAGVDPGGRWAVFLDADDELEPGVCAALDAAGAAGCVAMVGGRVEFGESVAERERPAPAEWADRVLPAPGDVFRPIQLFATTGMAVRGDVACAGVRFDPGLSVGEDREFLRRVADLGAVWVSGERVVRYRKHAGGGNLTGSGHLSRAVDGLVVSVRRHLDDASGPHLREQAEWLVSQAGRHGLEVEAWDRLVGVFRERGWRLPVKPRVRRWLRGRRGAG